MPEQQIRQTLTDLHEALGRTEKVDAELRSLLEQVDADINALLAAETRDPAEVSSLRQRVEDLGADFAARHPHGERLVQELIAALGRMGI